MKRILLMVVLLISSSAYADDALEIARLKMRVARLEQLVQLLMQNQQRVNTPLVIPNGYQHVALPVVRKEYKVILQDGTSFLIYKWDRQFTWKSNSRTRKRTLHKQYVMYDVFGKKSIWSCDKVRSISLSIGVR